MKNSAKLISVMLAGGIAGSVSGQLVVSEPVPGNPFVPISAAFTNDITSLFSDSANAYNSFTFGWDGGDSSTGTIVSAPGYAAPGGTGQANEIDFTRIDNPTHITIQSALNVAYIGNESNDLNFFGVEDVTGATGDTTLYQYQNLNNAGAPNDPTQQWSLPPNPDVISVAGDEYGGGYDLTFWHEDAGGAGYVGNPRDTMANTNRFYVFTAIDNVVQTQVGLNIITTYDQYWLLAVDDRESQLIDYDDGLFLLQTSFTDTIAIPEPSTIGFGAIALLLGLGITRRSRKLA